MGEEVGKLKEEIEALKAIITYREKESIQVAKNTEAIEKELKKLILESGKTEEGAVSED